MTTDYKDRYLRPEDPDERPPPRWNWLAIGMLVGAILMWLGTLAPDEPAETPLVEPPLVESPTVAENPKPGKTPPPPAQAPSPAKPAAPAPPSIAGEGAAPLEAAATASKPQFEFYTVLPEQEVVVGQPGRETKPATAATTLPALHASQVTTAPPEATVPLGPAAAQRPATPQTASTTPAVTKPPAAPPPPSPTAAAAATPGNRFMLQMGSFRNQADADKMRAQAALAGVVADVQRVTLENGEVLYRVRSSVLDGVESNRLQQRLKENGITTMLMRLK